MSHPVRMNALVSALQTRAASWHGMDLSPERVAILERMLEGHTLTDWLVLARRGPEVPNLGAWAILDGTSLLIALFRLSGRQEAVSFGAEKVPLRSIDGLLIQAGPTYVHCTLRRTGLEPLVVSSQHAYDPAEATLAVQAFVDHLDRRVFSRPR